MLLLLFSYIPINEKGACGAQNRILGAKGKPDVEDRELLCDG